MGRRFRGGRRNGCKVLRPSCAPDALSSELSPGLVFVPLVCFCSRSGLGVSLSEELFDAAEAYSSVDELFTLSASDGCRDDFRGAKNGDSGSPLGDSYAFGMAGTGGTPSSLAALAALSERLLEVGNLDTDAVCCNLVWLLDAFVELKLVLEETETTEL